MFVAAVAESAMLVAASSFANAVTPYSWNGPNRPSWRSIMPRISPFRTALAGAALVCIAVAPAIAQEAPPASTEAQDGAATASAPSATEGTDVPCKPKKKKKKGLGLGGLFKAAQSSGLTNLAGMGGLGKGGAVASAALGTAASLSDSAAAANAAKPEEQAASGC